MTILSTWLVVMEVDRSGQILDIFRLGLGGQLDVLDGREQRGGGSLASDLSNWEHTGIFLN